MEKEKQLIPQLRFSEFEKEWEKMIISKIANKITDGTHDTPKPIKEGVPFLTAIHVKDGKIDFDKCYYLSEEEHNKIYKRCNPEFGDLLMVNIGAGTATSAMVNVNYEFSLKNVALIKPNKEKIYPSFFAQVQRRNSDRLKHQISSGGAQPFLSLKAVGKLKLNIPSLPEQQKIAAFLTDVDAKITQLTQKKTLLEQYKKGLMQQLFNQELRFKDDNGNNFPDWEEKKLGEILDYEQPTKYIVKSTDYDDSFKIPVLTAGKSFLLGYTNETDGIYNKVPTIIFDDFTMANKYVDFEFKVKSSAMKILKPKTDDVNIKFIYEAIQMINYPKGDEHKRFWISEYSKIKIGYPCKEEQTKIANVLSDIDVKIEALNTKIENSKTFKKGLLQQLFV